MKKLALILFSLLILMAGFLPAEAATGATIHNTTPFIGEVYAGATEIAELSAGGVYSDIVSTRQYSSAVPLAIFFFRQTDSEKKYVGMAARIIPVYDYNNPQVFDWEINRNDIMTPDGQQLPSDDAPVPYLPWNSKILSRIPVANTGGQTNIQIANNSPGYLVRIFNDGKQTFNNDIRPAGVGNICTWIYPRQSIPISIQIDYLKPDGNGGLLLIASKSTQIWLSAFQAHAYQIIVGPPDHSLITNGY